MNPVSTRLPAKIIAIVFLAALPVAASAAWQTVAVAQNRRVDIDKDTIVPGPGESLIAKGRIVLDRPIVDPKTSESYHIIEIESRYDCAERTYATLKRTYYKEDDTVLRYEEVRNSVEMPVRSGTPDDRMLREVCRPKSAAASAPSLNKTLNQVNEVTANLRKTNEEIVDQAVKEAMQRKSRPASGKASYKSSTSSRAVGRRASSAPAEEPRRLPSQWTYEGVAGPELWGVLSPDYAVCANGRRQSPIDLSEAFAVDLEPIQFHYESAPFRVVDASRYLQLAVYGGSMQTLGKDYRLTHVRFHTPSEFTVNGKTFDMEAQLVHTAEDGKFSIVSILLEKGGENPVIQSALNNLPLEKGGEFTPPGLDLNLKQLLPSGKGYFIFMGSLTTPPCTEDVLWMVLKQPQQVSAEQLAMFQRLYPPNARPVQPTFERIIKESR
jgi:carbonic anhydrase